MVSMWLMDHSGKGVEGRNTGDVEGKVAVVQWMVVFFFVYDKDLHKG